MNSLLTEIRQADIRQGPSHFSHELARAVSGLRERLHQQYVGSFVAGDTLLHRLLDEAEDVAWETPFPQLFLPELAEARIAQVTSGRISALALPA